VEINKEKMSKSLGNFFTIREVFEQSGCREIVTSEVLRYFLLATHYRSPLDFSDAAIQESKRALDGLYDLFLRLEESTANQGPVDGKLDGSLERLERGFREAMDDDCNTPVAIAQFQQLRNDVNALMKQGLSRQACIKARANFQRFGAVVGLFQLPVRDWEFKDLRFRMKAAIAQEGTGVELTESDVEALLVARREARQRKDFARADEIRKQLASQGITIEDRPDGTSRWKR